MSAYKKIGLLVLLLAMIAPVAAGDTGAPDVHADSYWVCEHSVMTPSGTTHRSHISAIVDDAGRIWTPFYQVIETNARYGYRAGEDWRTAGFSISQLASIDIQLTHPPTRPLWQQVLADGGIVVRRLAVPESLIAADEAHETVWGINLSGDALAVLADHEDWRLQLVDEDGAVFAEQSLKDRSRADIEAEQRSQIEWLVRAASAAATYCMRSTPESREADEMSVI